MTPSSVGRASHPPGSLRRREPLPLRRIGDKTFPLRGSLPARVQGQPKTAPEEETRELDLVELKGGTAGKSLQSSLFRAGKTALITGLPVAGALLGGPLGLGVGVLASGTLAYLDEKEGTKARKLQRAAKKTLTGVALSLVPAGLGAMVAGALGFSTTAAAAATGAIAPTLLSGLVGADSYKNLRFRGKAEFKEPAFAKAYHGKVQAELEKKGVKWKARPLGLLKRLSPAAREEHARKVIAATAIVACRHLGPAVTLALANQVGKEGLPESKRAGLDAGLLQQKVKPVSTELVDGVPVHRIEGLKKAESSPGIAQTASVFLDSEHQPSGDALSDFIVGHELSHVKNQDVVGSLAENKVYTTLEDVAHKSGDPGELEALIETGRQIEEQYYRNSRETEFRCDSDGFEHARSRGHSSEEIVQAATELFGEQDHRNDFSLHPSGKKRVEALKKQARGKTE